MSDNEFNSAVSDDSLRSMSDNDQDELYDTIKELERSFNEEKITTNARINLINERIVDGEMRAAQELGEIRSTYETGVSTLYKILDEDRDSISNEIVGLHTRIDANIDLCKKCIEHINKLETEISNIKENLIPSKSLCGAVTTLYVLTGICVIHTGGVVFPLIAKLIKK